MIPRASLLFLLAVTVALYWAGLSGPFIFDDPWNLEPVRLWLDGRASLWEVIFPSSSLVSSRPVSMASFALTTWVFGDGSFSFKLGNLFVHLGCGVLSYTVLQHLFNRDARLAPHAQLLALLATAFWLLHPLQVSTVLYAVQRMAQLSTFFTLAAVCFYLVGRQQLIDGRRRAAWLSLFLGFPAMLALGLLSKQNAAVGPAICLVLELAYFNRPTRQGQTVATFFATFLLAPALCVIALLAVMPEKLLAPYSEWEFTLWERLLTQPRALLDYLGMLIFPRGPMMGLYTDDFAVSHGLLSPPSTLFALLALTGLSATAIVLRKRAPSFFAGWFFFLVAHGVESSFLPLEMYYEHRNYLPSLGFFLAVMGLLALVPAFRTNLMSPRKLGLAAAVGFALVLCVGTLGRVLVWQDIGTIAQLGVRTHPDSMRARFDVSAWALQQKDYGVALDSMKYLAESNDVRRQQMGNLSIVVINCMRGDNSDSIARLRFASAAALPSLNTFQAQAFNRLAGVTRKNGCGDLPRSAITLHLKQIIDSTPTQPETAAPKWFARYALAEIYVGDQQWLAAQDQAKLSWQGGRDKKVGLLLGNLYAKNGDLGPADALVPELEKMIKPYDKMGQAALASLKKNLAIARSFARPGN